MATRTVTKTQDIAAVRYTSDAEMVHRRHELTRTFRGEDAYDKAANYVLDAPEPYRSYMMIDERTESWDEVEEYDCNHEWLWQSFGMKICASCAETRPIEPGE